MRKRREVPHVASSADLLRELIEMCTRHLAEEVHTSSSQPASARPSTVVAPPDVPVVAESQVPPAQLLSAPPSIAMAAPAPTEDPTDVRTSPAPSTQSPVAASAAGPSEPSALAASVGKLTVGKKRGRGWSWPDLAAAGGETLLGSPASRPGVAGGGGVGSGVGGGGAHSGIGAGTSGTGVGNADGVIRAFGLSNEMAMLDGPPISSVKRSKGAGGCGRKDKREKDKDREYREWDKLRRM